MDLGRQRGRKKLYRFNVVHAKWFRGWAEPSTIRAEDGEPLEVLSLHATNSMGYRHYVEVLEEVRALYNRSSAAQALEAEPVKKSKDKTLVIQRAKIPQKKPVTVFTEKYSKWVNASGERKTRLSGWVAMDPSWRMIRGSDKTKGGAENALRVQIAAKAWFRMGGRVGRRCSPLPAVLSKVGKTWTATSRSEVGKSAEGKTIQESLLKLCEVLGRKPSQHVEFTRKALAEELDDTEDSMFYEIQT